MRHFIVAIQVQEVHAPSPLLVSLYECLPYPSRLSSRRHALLVILASPVRGLSLDAATLSSRVIYSQLLYFFENWRSTNVRDVKSKESHSEFRN